MEGAVRGDVREHHLGAVPRHPGMVPGDPGRLPPVGRELRPGDEPAAVVGEFTYRAAVVGGRAVQGYSGDHPAQLGGALAGELLQDAPHFAPVGVELRVGPAQPAAGGRGRGERHGFARPVGGVGVQPLVGEVDEDDQRAALGPRGACPRHSAVLDDPAPYVPRCGQHAVGAPVRPSADQGAAARLGRARLRPPHLVPDGADVLRASVVGGGERGVDRRRPGSVSPGGQHDRFPL